MAKRLLTRRQIQAEKFPRSRSWIFAEIAAGRFPKPIGGCVPHLWEESVIDEFVEAFVAKAKRRESETGKSRKAAAARASAARATA
jgi:predicted DNA-binding transcriptional regulator AlpA